MRTKVLIGAIAIGIGIGIGTAIYYSMSANKDKDNYEKDHENNGENILGKNEISESIVNNDNNDTDEINLSSVKQGTASTIKERHEEAAQIMRESMERIYEENESIPEEVDGEIDEINAQLDDLLN